MKTIEIGAFEAKNRLSELHLRAEKGLRIYITRRGKRVAILTSTDAADSSESSAGPRLLEEFKAFRASTRPGPEPLRQLVEEGCR